MEQRKRAETAKESVRRVALVIGNGAYVRVRPLPNPTNDARAMAKSLRDIGFVVTEGTGLDRTAMRATIRGRIRRCSARSIWRRSDGRRFASLSLSLRGAPATKQSIHPRVRRERWIASQRSQ
jgi:hypothetical protein